MENWLKNALQYLVGLGEAKEFHAAPDDDGVVFDKPVHRAPQPAKDPLPGTLWVSTLRSLAKYVAANKDGLAMDSHILHVEGPGIVKLIGPEYGYWRQRTQHADRDVAD